MHKLSSTEQLTYTTGDDEVDDERCHEHRNNNADEAYDHEHEF